MPPSTPQGNGRATAALVLGLASVLLFWTLVVPILAIVFGLVGVSRAKQSNGTIGGLGQGRAGWILGTLGVAGFIAIVAAAAGGAFDDGSTNVFSLEVGRCYDLPLDSSDPNFVVSELEEVPCDEPHNGELIYEGRLNPNRDREYTTEDALWAEARELCEAQFEPYVGVSYEQSELLVAPLVAERQAWDITRGSYSCFALLPFGAELTEPVRGSGR